MTVLLVMVEKSVFVVVTGLGINVVVLGIQLVEVKVISTALDVMVV